MSASFSMNPHLSRAKVRRAAEPVSGVPARAWLAGSVTASAIAAADDAFSDFGASAAEADTTPADLARRLEERGLAPLLAWAETVALAGLDREPWAREAAIRAVRAYAGRLRDLMAGAGEVRQ